MNLASHNSMTYLPVKQWWLKPFAWMAKCQSKDIIDQYIAGCRIFDIRLKPTNIHKEPEGFTRCYFAFGHNLITYKFDDNHNTIYKYFDIINKYSFKTPQKIYIRILLEYNKRNSDIENHFKSICDTLSYKYSNITFCGGHTKADWSLIYNFEEQLPPIIECYSSMPSNPKWCGIWPWLYAKLNNKKNKKRYSDKFLMLDFI